MKKNIKIWTIRIVAILVLMFAIFNSYRGFSANIIPVAVSFLFIGFIALIIVIKPKILYEEKTE